MDNDVIDLIQMCKIPVLVVEEDLATRASSAVSWSPGVELISVKTLLRRMAEYDIVSHW